jgi:hypothetical protein
MPPDEPNAEERQEELPQDYQTPFSPPADANDDTSDGAQTTYPTDPATDTGIQEEEIYDEGPYGASQLPDPKGQSNVVGYRPPKDKRPPIL